VRRKNGIKKKLIGLAGEDDLSGETIQQAKVLKEFENTGIHACGVIITPSDITDFVPVPPKIRIYM
jgi:DNA polymerase-3 subunit alpha